MIAFLNGLAPSADRTWRIGVDRLESGSSDNAAARGFVSSRYHTFTQAVNQFHVNLIIEGSGSEIKHLECHVERMEDDIEYTNDWVGSD